MAFNYFSGTGYQGQDLHVLRNGQAFTLSDFIVVPSGATVTYLPGLPASASYENIVWNVTGSGPSTVATITASAYTATTQVRVDNFYVTVTIVSAGITSSCKILIHVHESITKVWLSPSPLTIRNHFDNIRFGVFVKFNDNVVTNITWYSGFSWSSVSLPAYLSIDSATGRITITGTWPTTAPSGNFNVQMTLPANLLTTGSPTTATGEVTVSLDNGEVFLISGDPSKTTTRKNVILLSDGFTNSDKSSFKKFAGQLVKKQLNKSGITVPWKYFKDSFNYWGYFVPSREGGGILDGDYILLQNTLATSSAVLVEKYLSIAQFIIDELQKNYRLETTISGTTTYTTIKINGTGAAATLADFRTQLIHYNYPEIDSFIDWSALGPSTTTFPVLAPVYTGGSTTIPATDILGIQWMYDNLGLPGITDGTKAIATKRNDAVTLGVPTFKVPGDASITAGDKYLPAFVYRIWQQMIARTALSYPDTAFGARRFKSDDVYLHEIRNKNLKRSLNLNLAPLTYQYKDKATHSTVTLPLGAQFFTATGVPVLDPVYNEAVNGNNILMLSRTPTLEIGGQNTSLTYTVASVQYVDRMTVVPIYEGHTRINPCVQNVSGNTDSIISKNMPISSMGFHARNALIHEFSHNYLLDEYTNEANDLGAEVAAVQILYTNMTLKSNLQTKQDILAKIAANPGTNWGDNIKWLWPRISKVAVSTTTMTQIGTTNEFYIEIGETAPNKTSFAVGENVLIRKKDLFEAQYPKFEITAIDTVNPKKYTVKQLSGTAIVAADHKIGTLMILPIWTSATEYLKLVHKDVVAKINTNSPHPLVDVDTNYAGHDPQPVSLAGLPATDILRKFKTTEKIVGLYGGGNGNYNAGIYHPTGFCLMRKTDMGSVNYLCHVCRYIVVDAIDPLRHPDIDKDYGKDYPA